jgi:hypothetical protein
MTPRPQPLCRLALAIAIGWSRNALAYRPFDGTDADVAAPNEVELEIGPAGYHQEGSSRFVVAPALVANYGFAPGFEAVLEGRQNFQLSATRHPWQVEDVAFSIKSLLRRGSLQGASGIAVALELGMLLPGSESRWGAHVASIFSLHWPTITVHLNLVNDVFCALQYDARASLIVEGPDGWRLRPVAELLAEREFGQARLFDGVAESALVGGIFRWTDSVSFDVAGRYGRGSGWHEEEARAGLTWSFEPW